MKRIFETSVPRDEVLRGELRDQQFAASLTKVLRGNADEIFAGFAGNNTFDGGAGSDTVMYDRDHEFDTGGMGHTYGLGTGPVTVNLGTSNLTIFGIATTANSAASASSR